MHKEGGYMKQRRVTMEEGMQILLEELQPGEEKTPRELINILQENIEGVSNTQCYGIIYRARTNTNGVLQKKGKMYSLADEFMKQEDGIVEVRQKIRKVIQDIENIAVSKFYTIEDFEKLQSSLQSLTKIKEGL